MVGRKSTEDLPAGWIEQIKTKNVKFYTNEETGQKFYSKKDVIRYVNMGSISHGSPQQPNQQNRVATEDEAKDNIMPTNETPEWLPPGWRIESRTRKSGPHGGKEYKIYINPSTGAKFYSKPQVLQHQKNAEHSDSTSKTRKRGDGSKDGSLSKPKKKEDGSLTKQKKLHDGSPCETKETEDGFLGNLVMKANETPEWLPAGWIMEWKTHQSGSVSGRKHKCYIDPSSGGKFYSKPQVLQHLKNAEHGDNTSKTKKMGDGSLSKPKKKEDGSLSKQKKKEDGTLRKKKKMHDGSPSEPMETEDGSLSNPVMKANETPKWLPSGWIMAWKTQLSGRKYKCFIDPSTGFKFYSKPQVFQHLNGGKGDSISLAKRTEDGSRGKPKKTSNVDQSTGDKASMKLRGSRSPKTVKQRSSTSEQKQKTFDQDSRQKVVIERAIPDMLPPGWIKEIKIQRKGNSVRKDPFYTDPVSGYVFRSQQDALRYLESGDISKCAIKPKKRDELEWLTGDISPPAAADSQNSQHQTTKRRLFEGKQAAGTVSLETKAAESSRKLQHKTKSSDATTTLTTKTDTVEGNQSLDEAVEAGPKKEATLDSSSRSRRKSIASRRKGVKVASAENGPPSTPLPVNLQGEKLPGDGKLTTGKKKTQSGSSNSSKRKGPSLPSRSSKRLSGLKSELAGSSVSTEGAVQAEAGKSGNDPKPSLAETLNKALGIESLNGSEEHMEEEAVVENPLMQETDSRDGEKQEPELYQLGGSSWLDPCLDFAFKTLNGGTAGEQGPVVQDYFQQEVDAANKKMDGGLPAPEFGSFNSLQSDVSAAVPFDFLSNVPSSASGKVMSGPESLTNPFFRPASMSLQQSPANPLFPPGSMPVQQSPANPLFHQGSFGFPSGGMGPQ